MRKVGNYAVGTDEEWRSIDLQETSPVQEGEGGVVRGFDERVGVDEDQ